MLLRINSIYLHSQDMKRQMSENGPTGSSASLKLFRCDQYAAFRPCARCFFLVALCLHGASRLSINMKYLSSCYRPCVCGFNSLMLWFTQLESYYEI